MQQQSQRPPPGGAAAGLAVAAVITVLVLAGTVYRGVIDSGLDRIGDSLAQEARPTPTAKPKPPPKETPTKKPEPRPTACSPWLEPRSSAACRSAKAYSLQKLTSAGLAHEFTCLEQLWIGESQWDPWEVNPDGGAYGIPQILPRAHGHPVPLGAWKAQVDWGLEYIRLRYKRPCVAWAMWQARDPHWYFAATSHGTRPRRPAQLHTIRRPNGRRDRIDDHHGRGRHVWNKDHARQRR